MTACDSRVRSKDSDLMLSCKVQMYDERESSKRGSSIHWT